ncbi:MAG: trimethylamine methyltransferase family protein [Chloroflexi bacterium]|nr:trimethylamine methyltransferase family protein [Chloroflexota bacterium]
MGTTPDRTSRHAARRERRAEIPLAKIPFKELRNPFPPLEIIPPEGIEKIHESSLRLLEEVGLCVMDAEALSLYEKAGAKVDHASQMVWIDRGLLMETVAQAPAEFTWRARNPERNVRIGSNRIALAPNVGMAYASDLDRGRRRGTTQDYENFCKLGQMCNVIHINGGEMVALQDTPSSIRHLRRLRANFLYTDKPIMEALHGRIIPQDCFEMAKMVFGDIGGDPVLGGVINCSSPLRYDDRMAGGLISYARAGQIVIVTPFISAGAMGPITIAGALTQQNAEALAGIALTQIVRPGAPVMYGNFTTSTDMKSGAPAFGTPEAAWATLVGAQLARRYRIPFRGSGSLNTAKVPDAQAAYESLWSAWPVMLAGAHIVLHSVGWLEGGLTASFEKWIIDAENMAMFIRFFGGFEINDDTLALDMINEVGPGGHHFGTPHTQARFATEFHQSALADRLGYETWAAAGGWDAAKRANQIWKDMLAHYEPPPLDAALQQALAGFVQKREKELEGKNLYD